MSINLQSDSDGGFEKGGEGGGVGLILRERSIIYYFIQLSAPPTDLPK